MNGKLGALTRPLLFLVLFNLLPQLELRPLWSIAFSMTLLGYRFWIDIFKIRHPPRWAVWTVQITVALAIWQHYHSFFGDEAGGTFLTLLACVKIFELKRKRDYFLTCILCFLVLMSYLLLDQGLMMTAYLVVDVVLILTFLFALEEERWSWVAWRPFFRPAVTIVMKAAPLVAITFLLFPRFTTGFGSNASAAAKMGVTDALRPGAVSQLINSDELVFRAAFLNGEIPPRTQMYWRGAVLDRSNGLNWDRSKNRELGIPVLPPQKPDIEVYLEPGSDRFLFTLDNVETASVPNGAHHITLRDGKIFELDQPLQTRERYYMQRGDQVAPETSPPDRFLGSEEKESPELHAFLKKFEGQSDSDIVKGLLQNFGDGEYHYSLEPPPAATIEDFLFKTKTGFCEHFAGSLATMLRYLKVPSRVVVGFQGGTPSFLDNYVSVRGHDAHAWVEFYDREGKRWHRVDPTSQLDPQRISLGSDSYLEAGNTLMPRWMPAEWSRFYLRSRAFVDEVEASWIGFLLRFDLAAQKELLSKLGMEEALFRALPVFLGLALVLILALLYFIEARRRVPLTPDEKIYRQLIVILKKWRIGKEPQEGPLSLYAKAQAFHPVLGEAVGNVLGPLLRSRFGPDPLSAERLDLLKRRLRQLKKLRVSRRVT